MKLEPVLYRGIDFVLKTRAPSKALTDKLADYVTFNRAWKRMRTIVLSGPGNRSGADFQINAFCDLIERLPAKANACWNSCSARKVDIGIDSGNVLQGKGVTPLEIQIASQTLERAASLRMEIVITVYPHVVSNPKGLH